MEPNETTKTQLEIELTRLDDEARAELADFLKVFNDGGWLKELKAAKDRKEKARRDERSYQDSLIGQDKSNYFIEKLRDVHLYGYPASFQREVLELLRTGQTIPTDDEQHYCIIEKLNERFEDCSMAFRQDVIDKYLITVLPEMEVEQEAEDTKDEALDSLVDCVRHMTTGEIIALIEEIEKASMV